MESHFLNTQNEQKKKHNDKRDTNNHKEAQTGHQTMKHDSKSHNMTLKMEQNDHKGMKQRKPQKTKSRTTRKMNKLIIIRCKTKNQFKVLKPPQSETLKNSLTTFNHLNDPSYKV